MKQLGWLLSAALAGPALAACPPAATATPALTAEGVQLAWSSQPAQIVAGRPFVLLLQLCPAPTRLLAVDATMPEHRHGMNYRPSLQALGEGRWRVEGLLWHMSGRWELRFDVADAAGAKHTLRQSVTLP